MTRIRHALITTTVPLRPSRLQVRSCLLIEIEPIILDQRDDRADDSDDVAHRFSTFILLRTTVLFL